MSSISLGCRVIGRNLATSIAIARTSVIHIHIWRLRCWLGSFCLIVLYFLLFLAALLLSVGIEALLIDTVVGLVIIRVVFPTHYYGVGDLLRIGRVGRWISCGRHGDE
jgi:hypothetical protein